MPLTGPFEAHTDRYECWFETHESAYRSELAALRRLVLEGVAGVEVGVGSTAPAIPPVAVTGRPPTERGDV